MKIKILLITLLSIFVTVNIISHQIAMDTNLSLNNLYKLNIAKASETEYKWHCLDTEWTDKIIQCYPSGDWTYCDYYERQCQKSTSGEYDYDATCTSIWCCDCTTDLCDWNYNDCDI